MKGYRFKRNLGKNKFLSFLLTSFFLFISLSDYWGRDFSNKVSAVKLENPPFKFLNNVLIYFKCHSDLKWLSSKAFVFSLVWLFSLKMNQVTGPCFKNWNWHFNLKDLKMFNWPVCLEVVKADICSHNKYLKNCLSKQSKWRICISPHPVVQGKR